MLACALAGRCGAVEALPLRVEARPVVVEPVRFGKRGAGWRRVMPPGARNSNVFRPGKERAGRDRDHDGNDDRPGGPGRGPQTPDGRPKPDGGGRDGRGDDLPRDSSENRPPPVSGGRRPPGMIHMICIGGRVRDDRCECSGVSRQLGGGIYACGNRGVPVLIPVLGGFGGSVQPPQGTGGSPGGPAAALPGTNVAGAESFVADEVLVSADRASPDSSDDAVAQSHGLQLLERINLDHLDRRLLRFRIPDGRPAATVTLELQNDARIYAPQPNYYYRQQQAEDTASSLALQYALVKLDVPRAEQLAHGAGALIAVIDSGVDQTHPDLSGSVADVFSGSGAAGGGDPHGTEIAGIICAHGVVRGVAPDARLLDVRVFKPSRADRPSVATTSELLRGIDWALAKHARVLNMSFAGPRDALLEISVGVVSAKGAIVVAAAGNEGAKAPFAYPAAYPDVIAVTATDIADHLYPNANHGGYIALAAPGVDVLVPSGDHAHQLVSGTSYAAAHVTGIVALMIERNRTLTASAARQALTDGAVDLGPPGPDDQFGAGRVNALASLQAIPAQ